MISRIFIRGPWFSNVGENTQATARIEVPDKEERGGRPIFCANIYEMCENVGWS